MAIDLVRKPSETPNINNYDDYRMFRYATGGVNGVVANYGNECDYEIDGLNFKIKSGEIVIDGVQAKISSGGEIVTINNIDGIYHYVVYCEINLSLIDNQKTSIKSSFITVPFDNYSYWPTITLGDDLTQNQTGIARIPLYRFKVKNGIISTVTKQFKIIKRAITMGDLSSIGPITTSDNGLISNNVFFIETKQRKLSLFNEEFSFEFNLTDKLGNIAYEYSARIIPDLGIGGLMFKWDFSSKSNGQVYMFDNALYSLCQYIVNEKTVLKLKKHVLGESSPTFIKFKMYSIDRLFNE